MKPFIADFGLSKVKDANSRMSTMVGTAAWMSPVCLNFFVYTKFQELYDPGNALFYSYQ
jgi:hypothetical protein